MSHINIPRDAKLIRGLHKVTILCIDVTDPRSVCVLLVTQATVVTCCDCALYLCPLLTGSLDKAKRTVRRDIGSKWPDLARELGFSQSDIDDIRERERGSINGQIFEMLRQWERRSDTGKRSVCELLFGLRKAVNNTKDMILQEIRDKVFTDAVLCESCRQFTGV